MEGAKLIAVATDTHRLAYCEAEIDGLNQETKIEAIVPRKTVRELLRILLKTIRRLLSTLAIHKLDSILQELNLLASLLKVNSQIISE